ncbi:MAG TPA: lecithin retinol acyltransferase family protein [Burkholderiales bacterium]|nr:lecithin retinol acyltransferase family protein [Burkholderiales bacterium]
MPVFTASKLRAIEERINNSEGAIAEVRKHLGRKGYDLQVNNCEHFATFCKTDRKESFQVMEFMWGLAPAKSIELGRTVAEATGLED